MKKVNQSISREDGGWVEETMLGGLEIEKGTREELSQ